MQRGTRSALILGFALGGFFDGILLHQILQWHHLLSLVPGVDTLRAQVLWDGYFHGLMYVIAAIGLWGLWRARNHGRMVSGRVILGALLAGFGLWHSVDAVLSHWVLGIHRIRIDSPDPLLWDLLWLFGFGLVPLAFGWLLLRGGGTRGGRRGATIAVAVASLVTAGLAAWSLRPPIDQRFTTVVFAPGVDAGLAMAAVRSADARIVWSDPRMAVLVLDVRPAERLGFYRNGALLVSGSGVPSGCFGWSKGVA
ncbi:DUF2243 domain-containing protein [Croceibacterium ferulae]|uniref:DUF2243 domain-containing protein n=1 Tax=Croceibacterium ferulae TaxID=1854641 RepID=UPI000EB14A15|nr:DUF2243 domain-containing protein [Croceibacterium ferulae]